MSDPCLLVGAVFGIDTRWLWVQGSGFKVLGSRFWVQDSGFRAAAGLKNGQFDRK